MQKKNILSARRAIILIFFLLLFGFAFSRAYNMLYGPRITITAPKDGSALVQKLVTIRGTVKNAALIQLNGRKIFTDQDGLFSEDVVLQNGYNIITLTARDRFGHDKDTRLHVVYRARDTIEFSLLPN